jgi:hypothetical protein
VQQGEQEVPHARVSVGQTSGAPQRWPILDSAPELAIRDARVRSAHIARLSHRKKRSRIRDSRRTRSANVGASTCLASRI